MTTAELPRYGSGIEGLDDLLAGGYISERMYLVLGKPGTGKTLLGMSFLETGIENGENVLYIHGEESKAEILVNGGQVGIDLADADFLDLGPDSEFFSEDRTYELVDPADIADDRFVESIRERIEALDPARVLIDPISQLESLEPSKHQYRKRVISFMRFLRERGTTVLVTETLQPSETSELTSLSDGVVRLTRGPNGRRIEVSKHRGVPTSQDTHGLEIRGDGVEVFPALEPSPSEREFDPVQYSTGVENLDTLLGGGLERGTVTILSGPTGIGKSTTAAEFLSGSADEDTTALIYLFEENEETFTYRSENLGVPITDLRNDGRLVVEEVEPLRRSPEEFAQMVRRDMQRLDAGLVVIDGISGYKQALQGDTADTTRKLHALTRYLANENVSVMLLDEISQVTGLAKPTSENITYLADNIVFMNYVERSGHIDRVVGVLKKRLGGFEDTLRRFEITDDGIRVGEPVTDLHGVLDGAPELLGEE
jgi:circadian clock protein KaiC